MNVAEQNLRIEVELMRANVSQIRLRMFESYHPEGTTKENDESASSGLPFLYGSPRLAEITQGGCFKRWRVSFGKKISGGTKKRRQSLIFGSHCAFFRDEIDMGQRVEMADSIPRDDVQMALRVFHTVLLSVITLTIHPVPAISVSWNPRP
jgi:hypothetical protein